MVKIYLTPAGEDLIRRIIPQMVSAVASELSILTEEEQAQLGNLCRILGKNSRL